MRDAQSAVNHLVAWAREELAAQRLLLELLERQEDAVVAHDLEAVARAGQELERALAAAPGRAQRRERALRALGGQYGVPHGLLSLRSVAERHGAGAEPLLALRAELERAAREVARRNRRVGALLGVHRRVARDVIQVVLGTDGDGEALRDGGQLVDAEV